MERSVTHSTFVIERSYPATPGRVFAAFADPAKKSRWFVGRIYGHEVEHYELDFRVGGGEHSRFHIRGGPLDGTPCAFDASYYDIVPDRRIVYASTMTVNANRISASLDTVELLPSETGTDLIFTYQGAFFEGADGAEIREGGWRKLFEQLALEFPGRPESDAASH
jgi:uncharacterized protein YndB with AHSA1/START domain